MKLRNKEIERFENGDWRLEVGIGFPISNFNFLVSTQCHVNFQVSLGAETGWSPGTRLSCTYQVYRSSLAF